MDGDFRPVGYFFGANLSQLYDVATGPRLSITHGIREAAAYFVDNLTPSRKVKVFLWYYQPSALAFTSEAFPGCLLVSQTPKTIRQPPKRWVR